MGWNDDLFAVFDELEHRAEVLHDLERTPELADRSRAEYAGVSLSSRLMASTDTEISLEVVGAGVLMGRLTRVASDWCALEGPGRDGRDWVVVTSAITLARGLSARSVPEVAWSPVARLGLGSALRRIAEGGSGCLVYLLDGTSHEVLVHRVGADLIEVRRVQAGPESHTGQPAGEQESTGPDARFIIATAAIAAVASRET